MAQTFKCKRIEWLVLSQINTAMHQTIIQTNIHKREKIG